MILANLATRPFVLLSGGYRFDSWRGHSAQPGDALVDRRDRQLAASDLSLAVAVYLGNRDLRKPVPPEERQQVARVTIRSPALSSVATRSCTDRP